MNFANARNRNSVGQSCKKIDELLSLHIQLGEIDTQNLWKVDRYLSFHVWLGIVNVMFFHSSMISQLQLIVRLLGRYLPLRVSLDVVNNVFLYDSLVSLQESSNSQI